MVYVSNSERMQLGLQNYGSDVPNKTYEDAKAKLNPAPKKKKEAKKEESE